MNRNLFTRGGRYWLATALLCTAPLACGQATQGTETDNPAHQESPPPPYESPIQLDPNVPVAPGCPGMPEESGPDRDPSWRAAGETLLVGSDDGQLVVVDVADLAAPRVASVTPLRGYIYAVEASGSDVAVVVNEAPDVPKGVIATPEALEPTLRLVHYDLTDPARPERIGARDLNGEFWRLGMRPDGLWVMSAQTAETDQCLLPGQGCGYVDRTAIDVARYQFSPEGFADGAALQLPMTGRAWAGKDGFVTALNAVTDAGEPLPLSLNVARFDGERLVQSQLSGAQSPRPFSPVEVIGDRLFYFSEPDAELGPSQTVLHIVDVSGPEAFELAQVFDLPQSPDLGVAFAYDRVVVGDESFSGSGVVIDLAEPTSPQVAPLPPGVALAWPVIEPETGNQRLLGWGNSDGSGQLSVGWVGPSGLEQAVHSDFPAPTQLSNDAPLYPPSLMQHGDRLSFMYYEYSNNSRVAKVGSIDLAAEPLTLQAPIDAYYTSQLLSTDAALFGTDFAGVTVVPEPGQTETTRLAFEFNAEEVFNVVALADRQVTLTRRFVQERIVVQVVVRNGEAELARFDVPGSTRKLLPAGESVLLIADEIESECQQLGSDDCRLGLGVLDLSGDALEPVWTDLPPPPALPSGFNATQDWTWTREPVRLANGDWVLSATRGITCTLVSECEALGVEPRPLSEANVIFATPVADCPPGVEECPDLPAPPPPEVYGTRAWLHLFRVDVSHAAEPQLTVVGVSETELPDSRFAPLRVAGNTLLITRLEERQMRGQTNRSNARFMLDRFRVDGPDVEVIAPLNVPGYAVASSEAGRVVFTLEAGTRESAETRLHRLEVTEQGAYIAASRLLPERYSGLAVAGDTAYYLASGTDGCASGTLQGVALDAELTKLAPINLPGATWSLLDVTASQLLLLGPDYNGLALFDVSAAAPELQGFFAPGGETARIFGGEVWAPAYDSGILHYAP